MPVDTTPLQPQAEDWTPRSEPVTGDHGGPIPQSDENYDGNRTPASPAGSYSGRWPPPSTVTP